MKAFLVLQCSIGTADGWIAGPDEGVFACEAKLVCGKVRPRVLLDVVPQGETFVEAISVKGLEDEGAAAVVIMSDECELLVSQSRCPDVFIVRVSYTFFSVVVFSGE